MRSKVLRIGVNHLTHIIGSNFSHSLYSTNLDSFRGPTYFWIEPVNAKNANIVSDDQKITTLQALALNQFFTTNGEHISDVVKPLLDQFSSTLFTFSYGIHGVGHQPSDINRLEAFKIFIQGATALTTPANQSHCFRAAKFVLDIWNFEGSRKGDRAFDELQQINEIIVGNAMAANVFGAQEVLASFNKHQSSLRVTTEQSNFHKGYENIGRSF